MSGQLVGQAIGSIWGPWGAMIGGMIGGALFPSKVDGPKLDVRPQTSEYGQPLSLVYGTITPPRISVIWASEFTIVEGEGGKGGDEPTGDTAYGNFAVACCEADGDVRLGRIWAGPEKRLIWDGAVLEGAESGALLRFYDGADDQLPDALIESYQGVGNVPAYRGTAYVLFENFPLVKDGNRIPFLTIEVGKVTAEANPAPENLGIVFISQVIVTSLYYAVFYRGSYEGVVIRHLSDDTLFNHYTYDPLAWTHEPHWIWDEGRQVFIQRISTTMSYATIPIATGLRTVHAISAAGGADSNLGTNVFGHVYHNGAYIFAAKGSSGATDRVSLYLMDPDAHTPTFTYAADTGASGAPETLMKPIDASAYVYVASLAQTLTRHALASATPVVDMGQPALISGGHKAVDPNTGLIWSIHLSSGTLTVHVNDPATQTLVYSTSFTFSTLATRPFTFIPAAGAEPNKVVISGEQWLGLDRFALFDGDIPGFISEAPGGYHGISRIDALVYNPTADRLMAFHYGGWISFSDTRSDPWSANLLIAGTFTQELDNKYLGEADYSGAVTPVGEPLSDVVTNLSLRAGLTAGQIDVTDLEDDIVDGYAISSPTTVRDAIMALMPAYFFDAVESDGKVKFVKRGGAIAVVIPDDDVGAFESGSEPPDPLETMRRMENELPRTMSVRYTLAATDYAPAAKAAKRLVGSSGEEETLDMLSLVLTDTKGQEIAEVNLHGAWVARLTYSFTLPRKYGYLEPTDIIVVYGFTMRLTKTINADGIIKCEATHDDSNIYVPDVVVTETPPIDHGGGVVPNSETILELIGTNMLQDADNDAGFYAVACAADPLATWPGATLYHSVDGGASYSILATITTEAVMGYATTVLGNFFGGNIPDELSSVNVALTNGTLSSTTNAGLLSGVNTAIVGDEILHFRDATLESNGTYTLRGFLRGRRGSEYAMDDHAVEDRFILVSTATMVRVPQVNADIGQTRLYKAVTGGSTLAATTAQEFTNEGNGLKPYACTHLGGGRNAAGDATLNWSRRSRIDGAWRDLVDVPLGEASEAYEVEIYSDGTYTTLKRTITGLSTATATYLASDQTTDFGSPQATIYFRVYQMSATVGRGHAADGSV